MIDFRFYLSVPPIDKIKTVGCLIFCPNYQYLKKSWDTPVILSSSFLMYIPLQKKNLNIIIIIFMNEK